MRTRALIAGIVITAAATVGLVGQSSVAQASTPVYANCTAVHKVYSGGIALTTTKYNTVHHTNGTVSHYALKGKVAKNNALYNANKKLDADHDGIACEIE
jgi:hypothetical protein